MSCRDYLVVKGPFPASFYFCRSITVDIRYIKTADDWIRTLDLVCREQLFYQQCYIQCYIEVICWRHTFGTYFAF